MVAQTHHRRAVSLDRVGPLTTAEIRASFVNGSRGDAKRAGLPDLSAVPWESLDFLGWNDPSGSPRAYLVVPGADGADPIGLILQQTSAGAATPRRSSLCQLCLTQHTGSGVALTVASKTGKAGSKGDTAGLYMCRDLACSLYLRGKRSAGTPRLRETLSLEQMVARLEQNLNDFLKRVIVG